MIPKNRRIERKHFPFILKNGKRFNSSHFLLYVSENKTKKPVAPSRISFSVSKKITKTASFRNKLRRQGYSAIRNHLNKIKQGYFLFFSFKKGSQKIDYNTIDKEISKLLSESLMLL